MSVPEAASTIYPTTLCLMDTADPERLTACAVNAPTPAGDALLVFRSAADAEAYRADTGKHPASEGGSRFPWTGTCLRASWRCTALPPVAMPETWTGSGGVDLLSAANFLELLDTAEPVG